jgi:integrase
MPVYKDEKRGSWFASFYYTDASGEKRRKKKEGFKTRKEALEFERDFSLQSDSGPRLLFDDLLSLYIEDCQTRLRPTTMKGKSYILKTKIALAFKGRRAQEITAKDIRQWQNALMNDPYGFTPTYLKSINNQLSAIFNFGRKYYGLNGNPVANAGAFGRKKAEAMQFWTPSEFKCFVEAIHDNKESYIAFQVLFWTGMRSGELLALQPQDILLNEHCIRINKNYARLNGEDLILPTKTPKSNRSVTIPRWLTEALEKFMKETGRDKAKGRLFTLNKYYLTREIQRGSLRSNVKRIRVHDIRHSHASMLIELGFAPLLIAERLGHENVQTTLETYAHLYPNKHKELADRLQDIMLTTSGT